jgi:uncharacterized repeat protein (TIGR04076 family)
MVVGRGVFDEYGHDEHLQNIFASHSLIWVKSISLDYSGQNGRRENMAKIKVSVERIDGYCNLPMQVGNYFFVEDSKLTVPEGQHICIWALQSMMPIFPILEERNRLEDGHWVKEVKNFSCPDPDGLVQFRLDVVEE